MLRPLLVTAWILACAASATRVDAHPGASADIAALSQQLAERPGDAALLIQRAAAYRRQGQLDRALADLDAAARSDPNRREILLERGLLRAARKEPALAEADLTRFLASGPAAAAALAARGRLREEAGRWAEARADYHEALKLGADVELYLARGRADEALHRVDEAAAGYEEGMRATGGAVVLRLALIRVEAARGRYDRAIALVNEVLAAAPARAEWLLRRAEIHAAAGRPDAAERDRRDALREADERLARRPSDIARVTRARALLALARPADAAAELEQVARRSPKLEEAKVLLTEARRQLSTTKAPIRRGATP